MRDRIAGIACRDRKFAAGNEGGGLAGNRRQVRFGQRAHHTGAFHGAHGRGHRGQPLEDARSGKAVVGDQRSAKGGEWVAVVEVHDRGAVVHAGAEIDAHLLDNVAPHFRNIDLQHHLVAAADGDGVDDLVGAADQPRGEVAGLLGFDRARYRAGQDHAFADAIDLDSRQRLPQGRPHAVEVALDRDVVGADLLAVGVEKHHVGLADRSADDIGALRRANDGIGDLGIGHQYVLHFARQIDDHRFADAERKKACLDRADGRCRHRILAGIPGQFLGQFLVDLGRYDRHQRAERQRGDGRKQQGPHRSRPHR